MQDTLERSHDHQSCRLRAGKQWRNCSQTCGCKCHRFDCHPLEAAVVAKASPMPASSAEPETIDAELVCLEVQAIVDKMKREGLSPVAVLLHPLTFDAIRGAGLFGIDGYPAGGGRYTLAGLSIAKTTAIPPGQVNVADYGKPPNETPPVEIDCPKVYRDFLRIIEAMGRKDDKPSAVLMNPTTALALVAAGMTAVDKCDDGTYLDTLDGLPIYGVTVIPAGEVQVTIANKRPAPPPTPEAVRCYLCKAAQTEKVLLVGRNHAACAECLVSVLRSLLNAYQVATCPAGCSTRAFMEPGFLCSICNAPMTFRTLSEFSKLAGAK